MSGAMPLEENDRVTWMDFPEYIAKYVKASPGFIDGVRRGVAALNEGKIKPWEEVERELGLR